MLFLLTLDHNFPRHRQMAYPIIYRGHPWYISGFPTCLDRANKTDIGTCCCNISQQLFSTTTLPVSDPHVPVQLTYVTSKCVTGWSSHQGRFGDAGPEPGMIFRLDHNSTEFAGRGSALGYCLVWVKRGWSSSLLPQVSVVWHSVFLGMGSSSDLSFGYHFQVSS